MPIKPFPGHRASPDVFAVLVTIVVLAGFGAAQATEAAPAAGDQVAATTPATIDGAFASAILVDATTGLVLAAKDPDAMRQPASMLKMLTELIALERIEQGDIALDDTVTVSARASNMGGSQVYLAHRERFSVEDLLRAVAIQSANDAAVALAEHVAGSVEAFVDLMNDRARRLGMDRSEFHTVHGLPPGRGQKPDLTSARDMATLGRELLRYPRALEWSAIATAPFRNGEFLMYNPNKLVGKYRGLDGLKTGYHGQAGFCVTATAVQRGVRLLSVVMGCPSDQARATETTRLLSYGFNLYRPVMVVEAEAPLAEPVAVRGGKAGEVPAMYAASLEVMVPRDRHDDVDLRFALDAPLDAPVARGEKIGEAVASLDGHELGRVDILAVETVEEGSWFHRLFR